MSIKDNPAWSVLAPQMRALLQSNCCEVLEQISKEGWECEPDSLEVFYPTGFFAGFENVPEYTGPHAGWKCWAHRGDERKQWGEWVRISPSDVEWLDKSLQQERQAVAA